MTTAASRLGSGPAPPPTDELVRLPSPRHLVSSQLHSLEVTAAFPRSDSSVHGFSVAATMLHQRPGEHGAQHMELQAPARGLRAGTLRGGESFHRASQHQTAQDRNTLQSSVTSPSPPACPVTVRLTIQTPSFPNPFSSVQLLSRIRLLATP